MTTDMDSLLEAGKLRKELKAHTDHAKALVIHLMATHYPGETVVVSDNLQGLLSQLDSITQGMERKGRAA